MHNRKGSQQLSTTEIKEVALELVWDTVNNMESLAGQGIIGLSMEDWEPLGEEIQKQPAYPCNGYNRGFIQPIF